MYTIDNTPTTPTATQAEPALVQVAERLGKSPAQVLVRWSLERGVTTIPKSTNPLHLAENVDVFAFELSESDCTLLDGFHSTNLRCTWDPSGVR
jgi:diketogulonate reductase-like aldo/keto reductase